MRITDIRLEYGAVRQGQVCIIESGSPAISWAISGSRKQTAYKLTASNGEDTIWNTGWVSSTAQNTEYDGKPLTPGEINTLTVSLRGADGIESETAQREFCLGALTDWPTGWIGEAEPGEDRVISFVKDFTLSGVKSACLFVCGIGYHKVYLNGIKAFSEPMNPAMSEYEKRCYYTVLPGIERHLRKGNNRIGVEVASGWRSPYNICYKLTGRIPVYTGATLLTAALRLTLSDGQEEWIYTDGEWGHFYGPTVYSNIFKGEIFEAARAVKDWSLPETAIPELTAVLPVESPGGRMCPQVLEPICEQELYHALSVFEVAPEIYGVDFGQNLAGVCRLRIPRDIKAGQTIEIYHAEILAEDGRLYRETLRNADSVDKYIAAGDRRDPEYWQPAFTYHGFRYAEIKGYPKSLTKDDITAVSLYTDIASDGYFRCGNALVNQIQKNIIQTEKANIHSLLTDCPQRDERMMWLNDATVRFEETPYNFDIGRLFPKVVRDVLDIQDPDGSITCTAPFAFGARPADPVCSSYLVAGWEAYMHTGNLNIIAEGYEGFKQWNSFLESKSDEYIVDYSYYGDWAGPAYACIDEEIAVSAVTPGILMSTGFFYHNAKLLSQMATALGREKEATAQAGKANAIQQAFLNKWWDEQTGRVDTGSQGCQSFALWLDILPNSGRQKAADLLHSDLIENDYKITTGNLCTRYILDALTRFGYIEDAWAIVTREEYPSLGYMIGQEATTIWERFELKKNPIMNSHSHPMYGAMGYWFYAYLAGVKPLRSGWEEFSVHPYIPLKLNSVQAAVKTPFGDICVRWVKRYGEGHLYISIPNGVTAEITKPGGGAETVGAGFHHRAWTL